MSSEDDGRVSFALPGEVDDWLGREASRREESRDDVCRRLVTAAHAVATDDEIEPSDIGDLTAVQAKLDAQREEFTELLEDVRSRVVQVKRETDAKAPADHDHADYAGVDELDDLRADLEALKATVDDGFENFETVLESLLEETGTLEERATVLAAAVLDLREGRVAAAERERRRAAADRLKLAANRLGIRTAVCDDCDGEVDLALLTEPACPHCEATLTDGVENTSFFGSHTLVTGDPPALEGRVDDAVPSTSTAVFDAVEADVDAAAGENASDPTDANDASDDEDRTDGSDRTDDTGTESGDSRGVPVPEFEPEGSVR